MAIEQQVQEIEADAGKAIAASSDEAALEAIRVAELGKKGRVSLLMRELGGMKRLAEDDVQTRGVSREHLLHHVAITSAVQARRAERAREEAAARVSQALLARSARRGAKVNWHTGCPIDDCGGVSN